MNFNKFKKTYSSERINPKSGFILATDTSIVISGWKHGTSELSAIFKEELSKKNIKCTYSHLYGNNSLNFINNCLIHGVNKITNFSDFYEFVKEHYVHFSFYDIFNPTLEIFKALLTDDTRPIFIFIRDPKISFLSAFHQDLNAIVRTRKIEVINLIPSLKKFDLDNSSGRSILRNFITQSTDKEVEEAVKTILSLFDHHAVIRSHVNTFHLTEVLQFLNIVSLLLPSLLKRIFIVDLDQYSESIQNILIANKAMRKPHSIQNNTDGTLHFKKSNQNLYTKYKQLYKDEDFTKLPLGAVRIPVEEMCYSHINTLYRDNFLTESNFNSWKSELF